jgi:hypothetical protein
MVDPVVVCSPPAPDLFLGFSGAAWTAIGSIVSAASVITLVIFNWRYLHWAHKMSDSAADQATIAKDSLEALKQQISSDLALQRHTAIAVSREVTNQVIFWAAHFRTEVRVDQNPIQLIPDDWNILVAYVSRHLPDSFPSVTAASTGLRNVEGELNRLTTVPLHQRNPNSSLQVRYNGLGTNLENVRKLLNTINDALAK